MGHHDRKSKKRSGADLDREDVLVRVAGILARVATEALRAYMH